MLIGAWVFKPGDDLLSHGETPHYHRRCIVSLLSSVWSQVVPMLYGRQANWLDGFGSSARVVLPVACHIRSVNQAALYKVLHSKESRLYVSFIRAGEYGLPAHTRHRDSPQHPALLTAPPLRGPANNPDYMVKPHGQLVLVSSTPHNASTPSLST